MKEERGRRCFTIISPPSFPKKGKTRAGECMGIGRNTVCSFYVRTSLEQRTLHPCYPEPLRRVPCPLPLMPLLSLRRPFSPAGWPRWLRAAGKTHRQLGRSGGACGLRGGCAGKQQLPASRHGSGFGAHTFEYVALHAMAVFSRINVRACLVLLNAIKSMSLPMSWVSSLIESLQGNSEGHCPSC